MGKIRLIIVDDELTSRNEIKSYLQNQDIYEVVEDFHSGKQALEWLREHPIDIVLCDMQMPEMNGVEFMRSVHTIKEYLPIIAISGFDDFNYVRGSLINGAANYLLKHELNRQRLLVVLDEVREKYKIASQEMDVYHKRGHRIYDEQEFSSGYIQELVDRGQIAFGARNVITLAISPDYKAISVTNLTTYRSDICTAIIDIINQILGSQRGYVIYVTPKQHLLMLLSFETEHSMLLIMNSVNNLARRIQRQAVRMLDTTITLIIGDIHHGLSEAIENANHLENLLHDKLYLGGNRLEYGSVVRKLTYSQGQIEEETLAKLHFELEHEMPDCIDTIHEILEQCKNHRYPQPIVLAMCRNIVRMFDNTAGVGDLPLLLVRMEHYEEFEQYRTELLSLTNELIQKVNADQEQRYTATIGKVVAYVWRNYSSDISLETCATFTRCSYTYLSREFKKETGLRFVEFLNRQRVNRAKSLLIGRKLSMKAIGEAAGFRNYNYFFKVFKEVEGCTPTEYLAKK